MNEEYEFIGKSVWISKEKILVITDLHLGFEENLHKEGVFMHGTQYKNLIEDLEKIIQNTGRIHKIIVLGDLKHEFGSISKQERKEISQLIDYLDKKSKELILIRGNHDTILDPIIKKRGLKIRDSYFYKGYGFMHGDKCFSNILNKKLKNLFLGHLHPSINLKKGAKKERYKCFLVGKWKRKKIVILPSFFTLTEGSEVYMKPTNLCFDFNLNEFEAYIPVKGENKVLNFGKVKKIGELV